MYHAFIIASLKCSLHFTVIKTVFICIFKCYDSTNLLGLTDQKQKSVIFFHASQYCVRAKKCAEYWMFSATASLRHHTFSMHEITFA